MIHRFPWNFHLNSQLRGLFLATRTFHQCHVIPVCTPPPSAGRSRRYLIQDGGYARERRGDAPRRRTGTSNSSESQGDSRASQPHFTQLNAVAYQPHRQKEQGRSAFEENGTHLPLLSLIQGSECSIFWMEVARRNPSHTRTYYRNSPIRCINSQPVFLFIA